MTDAVSMAGPALLAGAATGPKPTKIHDAAQQFESLLMEQILHSAREGGGGWLGSGEEDPSGDCATGFAEQQLAAALASSGGIGMADLISRGLEPKPASDTISVK